MSITRRRFLKATAATLPTVGLTGWSSNALAAPAPPPKFVLEIVLRAGFHMNALFPAPGHRAANRHQYLNCYSSQGNIVGFTPNGGREVVFARFAANQGADLLRAKLTTFQTKIRCATSITVVPTTNNHTSAFTSRGPNAFSPCPAVLFSGATPAIFWKSTLPASITNQHPGLFPAPIEVQSRQQFQATILPQYHELEQKRYDGIKGLFSTQIEGGLQLGVALGSVASGFSAGATKSMILSLASNDWHPDIPANDDDVNSKQGRWNLFLGGQLAAFLQACSKVPDPTDATKMVLDSLFVSISSEFARTSLAAGGGDNGDGETQAFVFMGAKVRTGSYGDINGTTGMRQGFDPLTGNVTIGPPAITETMVYKTTGLLMGFSQATMDIYATGPSIPILVYP